MHRPQSFRPLWIDFFTQPCPHYNNQRTTFPKFSLLPKELQLMIWFYVEPEPQAIIISRRLSSKRVFPLNPLSYHQICYPSPALLTTCYTSQEVCLKHLTEAFAPYIFSRPALFNFDLDWISMDWIFLGRMKFVATQIPDPLVDLSRLKYLHVNLSSSVEEAHLIRLCTLFIGLQRLHIEEDMDVEEMDIENVTDTFRSLPYEFCRDDKSFIHDWTRMRRKIQAAIPYLRPKIEEWKPPVLMIGTSKMWRNYANAKAEKVKTQERRHKIKQENEMEWEPIAAFPSFELVPSAKTHWLLNYSGSEQ